MGIPCKLVTGALHVTYARARKTGGTVAELTPSEGSPTQNTRELTGDNRQRCNAVADRLSDRVVRRKERVQAFLAILVPFE